jgi:hypothetical protein
MFSIKLVKDDFADYKKWEEFAASLELPPGRDYAYVMRIPGLQNLEPAEIPEKMEIEKTPIPRPPKWLWGDGIIDDDRGFIIHTQNPRFICEIGEAGERDKIHLPFQYDMSNGEALYHFLWIDQPPEDLTALLNEAEDFINAYDDEREIE